LPPRIHRPVALATLFVLVGSGGLASAERPKAAAPASPLSIEAVRVTPAFPAPDTICHLSVTLRNAGEHTASRFELRVQVGGSELPAYRGRIFLAPLPAHGTLDLPLFNFWSTESSRKAPADGKLAVEVTLLDARWVEKTAEGGIETWSPLLPDAPPGSPAASSGAAAPTPAASTIPGLPIAKTVALPLAPVPAAKRP